MDELTAFLGAQGFHDAPATADPAEAADWLRRNAETSRSMLLWFALDPFGGVAFLLAWMLSRLATQES